MIILDICIHLKRNASMSIYIYIHIYVMYINAFYMSIYLWGCIEKLHAYLLCIGLLVLPLEVKPPKKWDVQRDAKGCIKSLYHTQKLFLWSFLGVDFLKKVHFKGIVV